MCSGSFFKGMVPRNSGAFFSDVQVVCSRVSGKQLGSYREGVLFIRAPKQHVLYMIFIVI